MPGEKILGKAGSREFRNYSGDGRLAAAFHFFSANHIVSLV